MPAFDSIFFDFDGVLADTEAVHCACWTKVLAPAGVPLDWDYYRAHCIGIDDRQMLRMLAARCNPPRDGDALWALYPAKKLCFSQAVESAPPFHPALGGFLRQLAAHYTLAVVSSSASGEIEPMLAAAGLRGYFQTVVGGEQVEHHKPAPDPYLLAATRLGVRAPLVVEDSAAGVASGQAAGFTALRVTNPADMPGLVRQRLAL